MTAIYYIQRGEAKMEWIAGVGLLLTVLSAATVFSTPVADPARSISLKPLETCICPRRNYTCVVNSGVGIIWRCFEITFLQSVTDNANEKYVEDGGFKAVFIKNQCGNFMSYLHVKDLNINNTYLTCEGVFIKETFERFRYNITTPICIVGEQFLSIDVSEVGKSKKLGGPRLVLKPKLFSAGTECRGKSCNRGFQTFLRPSLQRLLCLC